MDSHHNYIVLKRRDPCVFCGNPLNPAAGPWNYDMDAAIEYIGDYPDTPILIIRGYQGEELPVISVTKYRREINYWLDCGAVTYMAWAAINIPEVNDGK